MEVFYINICGFIGRGKFLCETRGTESSYLRYKVQLPTSDSTEITAGGIKVRLEGPVPLDAPSGKIHLYLTRVALVVSEILWGPKITLGGPAPPGRPWQKKYTQILRGSSIHTRGTCATSTPPSGESFVR